MIYQGDATKPPVHMEGMRARCAVTSPGYFGLRGYWRDHGLDHPHPDEMGREFTLGDYIDNVVAMGEHVATVLADDGVFFLNLGDTMAGSGGAGGDHNRGGSKAALAKYRQGATGLSPMQRCLVPERCAIALQEAGWLVRSVICWDKGQCKPEQLSHARRPLVASETILVLARSRDHYWDHSYQQSLPSAERGDVWHLAPYRGRRRHSAPFPVTLPFRAILLASEPDDLVYDPCAGSGTTGEAAALAGRRFIGLDLYADTPWVGLPA